MNNILLKILKEIGIAIIILVILAAVTVIAFKDQLPYDEEVPEGKAYVKANPETYSVSSTDRISEINAVTITHEANQGQIIDAENLVRIQTGKYTPFATINGTNDLPSEKVGIRSGGGSSSDSGSGDASYDSSTNSETETLEYSPTSDEAVKKIESDQSESSESAASRRMGNVD